jgi:uncharacterized protein YdhG (YjbR/CyaY superfamily)
MATEEAEDGKTSIDRYIAGFPPKIRYGLDEMRRLIESAAPQASRRISYRMPAYFLNGALVYFAGYEKHIGFYPTASGIAAFKDELGDFKFSKGAVQFPIDEPLPARLIAKIVKYRVKENKEKAADKKRTMGSKRMKGRKT